MEEAVAGSLLAHLARVPDPRDAKGQRHPLRPLLAIASAAILCGARSFAAIAQWGRCQDLGLLHRLGLKRSPPSAGAFRYLFERLDPAALEAALRDWVSPLLPAPAGGPPQPLAMDGKSLRGSRCALRPAVHLLSVLDQATGCVFSQAAVGDKTNEPKAALALLEGLVLEGRVVTGDAIFCQKELAGQIRRQGGHYLFQVKENQPTLLRDVEAAFEAAFSPLRGAKAAVRGRRGAQRLQARRAGGAAHAVGDDPAERLPGLAGRGPGVQAGAGLPLQGPGGA